MYPMCLIPTVKQLIRVGVVRQFGLEWFERPLNGLGRQTRIHLSGHADKKNAPLRGRLRIT